MIYNNFVGIKISIKYPKSYEAIFDPWFGFSREHYGAMSVGFRELIFELSKIKII